MNSTHPLWIYLGAKILIKTFPVNNRVLTLPDDKVHPRTGATILHVAAAKGYIDVLSGILNNKILRSQIDINAKDNENWTPLAAACYWQHPCAVQLLLLHGADVNVETISGPRLEDLTDHELILKLIEEKRAKLAEEKKLKEQMIMNGPQSKGLLNGTSQWGGQLFITNRDLFKGETI